MKMERWEHEHALRSRNAEHDTIIQRSFTGCRTSPLIKMMCTVAKPGAHSQQKTMNNKCLLNFAISLILRCENKWLTMITFNTYFILHFNIYLLYPCFNMWINVFVDLSELFI